MELPLQSVLSESKKFDVWHTILYAQLVNPEIFSNMNYKAPNIRMAPPKQNLLPCQNIFDLNKKRFWERWFRYHNQNLLFNNIERTSRINTLKPLQTFTIITSLLFRRSIYYHKNKMASNAFKIKHLTGDIGRQNTGTDQRDFPCGSTAINSLCDEVTHDREISTMPTFAILHNHFPANNSINLESSQTNNCECSGHNGNRTMFQTFRLTFSRLQTLTSPMNYNHFSPGLTNSEERF